MMILRKNTFITVLNSIILFDKIANTQNIFKKSKEEDQKKKKIKDINEIENEEMVLYMKCTYN